jgi:hypothetical protein
MAGLPPAFETNINYYIEFWKLYLFNEVAMHELQECKESVIKLRAKISRKEKLQAEGRPLRKKHNRRKANQIVRQFVCMERSCDKSYGSEVSLSLHMKQKHFSQSDTAPLA